MDSFRDRLYEAWHKILFKSKVPVRQAMQLEAARDCMPPAVTAVPVQAYA
jgi:hypothetical protein